MQPVLVDHRAGRDDAGDLAFHQAAANFTDLIADGDPQTSLDQPPYVGGGGVVGHAAHRHPLAFPELAGGENDLEDRSRAFGVLAEHLVEVAKAKQQDGVGLLLFYVKKLAPQRRQFRLGCRRAPPLTRCRTKTELSFSLALAELSPCPPDSVSGVDQGA